MAGSAYVSVYFHGTSLISFLKGVSISRFPNPGLGTISHNTSHGTYALLKGQLWCTGLSSQILVGILRHYVVVLLQSPPKKMPRAAIREQYAVIYSDFTTGLNHALDAHLCGHRFFVLHHPTRPYPLLSICLSRDIFPKHLKLEPISKMAHRRVTHLVHHRIRWTRLPWTV